MAYREVTMVEIKEVLRLWRAGTKKKRIAAQLTLDVKTVRRYVAAAESCGLAPGAEELTDDHVTAVLAALSPETGRPRGDGWQQCEAQRGEIERLLVQRVRLSKIQRLLHRSGVDVPYSTLHRFAVAELGFGQRAATIPVADGKPGEELHIDTGWMTLLEPDEHGRRRRFRAWIFTPHVSRYRFVYPCWKETTESAIEACEAAWEFYGGVFGVVVSDCTRAIVHTADPRKPRIVDGFLEYAQARGFHVDPTRPRHPKDKARTERTVRDVRDDCFGGEKLLDLVDALRRGRVWCADEYGMRRHSTTQRMPREHFEVDEKPHLLPAPTAPYDIPIWCEPMVGADQHAQVARSLYSLPFEWRNKRVRARADSSTVRFYPPGKHEVMKTHARVAPGKRSTDLADFPPEKAIYAARDAEALISRARSHGRAIGEFAQKLYTASPLPWTRMRQLQMLLGLIKRYGPRRVDETCALAVAADMVDVFRLERMLKLAAPPSPPAEPARVIPIGRYLRPATDYAVLPCVQQAIDEGEDS
jgi:Mu transposase, C-terminal domain